MTIPGSRWKDSTTVPLEERERRRDYFAAPGSGSGSGSADAVAPGISLAPPIAGSGPSSSKIARLKALTLPTSRRASFEEGTQRRSASNQIAEGPNRRSLTFDPPFHLAGTPSRRPSMPVALSEEPKSLALPPSGTHTPSGMHMPSVPPAKSSHSWTSIVAAAQKKAAASATQFTNPPQTPPSRLRNRIPEGEAAMHLSIPPSAFVPPIVRDGVPGVPGGGQWRREGLAPPTPDGWDNIYRSGADVPQQHSARERHLSAEPWNEPFEEAAEYDLHAGATNESGGTTAVSSGDRDRSLEDGSFGKREKQTENQHRTKQIRGMLRMDRGLRRKRLEESMGTRRQRLRKFLLADPFVTAGLRLFNFACVVTVLGERAAAGSCISMLRMLFNLLQVSPLASATTSTSSRSPA